TLRNVPLESSSDTSHQSTATEPRLTVTGITEQTLSTEQRRPSLNDPTHIAKNRSLPTLFTLPLKTSCKAPPQTSAEAQIQISTKMPLQTSTKMPLQTLTKTPPQTLTKTPLQTLTKTPPQTLTKTPPQTLTKTPPQTLTKTPPPTLTNTLPQTTTKTLPKTSTKTPPQVSKDTSPETSRGLKRKFSTVVADAKSDETSSKTYVVAKIAPMMHSTIYRKPLSPHCLGQAITFIPTTKPAS
ncbi:unnamed protein product, partial [Ixodes persulcatus]